MKKRFILIFSAIFILALAISLSSAATTIPSYKDKYVNDFAGFLSSSDVSYLRALLFEVDQNTTAEMVVVIVNDTGSYALSEYAVQIFDQWKVGKADKDNGLVIVYSVSDKKIWVSTGYGLEGILPDSKVGRILDESYVPLRDAGEIQAGIINATEQYAQVIEDNRDEVLSGQAGGNSNPGSNIDPWIVIFFLFLAYKIITSILARVYKGKKKKDLPWFFPIFIPIRSGGSSGGFGGGGFGGGGFGGGGGGGGGAGR